jgi:hypothetical protein
MSGLHQFSVVHQGDLHQVSGVHQVIGLRQ